MEEEIRKYFKRRKQFYESLLSYIDNNSGFDDDFFNLCSIIKNQKIKKNAAYLEHVLHLILNISNYHHRDPYFYIKIKLLLDEFKNSIKHTFSSIEIFELFSSNKTILLYLFKEHIIEIDERIMREILNNRKEKLCKYCHFFLPELKELIEKEKINKIKKEIIDIEGINLIDYDEKRLLGENNSYICTLIRNDSIEEFVSLFNKKMFSLSSTIDPSIFETNFFLIDKNPTLIEYSAFFGSIQIFRFLFQNSVQLSSSLWLYAIHGNNPEIIHILEENQIEPEDKTYEECLEESIKCHHNDFAEYFKNKIYQNNGSKLPMNLIEKCVSCAFQYYNYSNFPEKMDQKFIFFYLYKYKYNKIVDIYLKNKDEEIMIAKIQTIIYFHQISFF